MPYTKIGSTRSVDPGGSVRRVTGIGGIFFKAKDAKALQAWYKQHLGIDVQEWGGASFTWSDGEKAATYLRGSMNPSTGSLPVSSIRKETRRNCGNRLPANDKGRSAPDPVLVRSEHVSPRLSDQPQVRLYGLPERTGWQTRSRAIRGNGSGPAWFERGNPEPGHQFVTTCVISI